MAVINSWVEGWREEIKHQMATDLESLKVTIKEMEREIRRVERRGWGQELERTAGKQRGTRHEAQ